MSMNFSHGFQQLPDERDDRFPLSKVLGSAKPRVVSRFHKPGIVMNQGSLPHCFPAGTLIRMADGTERPIEDVRPLDQVVTAEGNIGEVTQLMVRRGAESVIKLSLFGHRHLKATPEHPVFTSKGYIPIGQLKIGDEVGMPKYMASEADRFNTEDLIGRVQPRVRRTSSRRYAGVSDRGGSVVQVAAFPEIVELTEDFAKVVGLFLAEGYTKKQSVSWAFNIKERDTLVAELVQCLERSIGAKAHLAVKARFNTIVVNIYGACWVKLFEGLCSKLSSSKKLHPILTAAPRLFQETMLKYWIEGDGYERRNTITGTSVSHAMAMSMYDIAQAVGLAPTIRTSNPKPSHGIKARKARWDIEFCTGDAGARCRQTDTHVWRKVVGIEEIPNESPVYNLEVEGDHSYVAEGIGVHNCVGFASQQLLQSEPVPQKGLTGSAIYREAKKIDEFGPHVGGTSIRAGMNVLRAKKLIEAYFWAKNSQQVIDYLLRYGPVVAGTPWYSGMNRTDRNGLVRISGKSEGGHAWLIVGANERTGLIHAINSWGMDYGIAGQFSLTFKDFDLLMQRGGVAAAAIEPGTKL